MKRITQVEGYQALKNVNVDDPEMYLRDIGDRLRAMTSSIRDDNRIQSIVHNPFASEAASAVQELGLDVPPTDVVRAMTILPRNTWDVDPLPASDSEAKKRFDCMVDAAVHVENWFAVHEDDLWQMSNADVYAGIFDSMRQCAFFPDLTGKQVQQLRIGILNLLQNMEVLRSYSEEAVEHPQEFIEKIFGRKIEGPVHIERTPVAFVLYVGPNAMKALMGRSTVNGCVINHEIPDNLRAKIILIKCADPLSVNFTEGDVAATRAHELGHIINCHFEAFPFIEGQSSAKNANYHAEIAKDEVLRYAFADQAYPESSWQLGFYGYESVSMLEEIQENPELFQKAYRERTLFMRNLTEYRCVVQAVMNQYTDPIDRQRMRFAMEMTDLQDADRVARWYLDTSLEKIMDNTAAEAEKAEADLLQICDQLIQVYDDALLPEFDAALSQIQLHFLPQFIGVLFEAARRLNSRFSHEKRRTLEMRHHYESLISIISGLIRRFSGEVDLPTLQTYPDLMREVEPDFSKNIEKIVLLREKYERSKKPDSV